MNIEIKLYRDFGSDLMNTVGGAIGGGLAGDIGTGMGLLFQGEQNANQQHQAAALGQIQVNDSEQLSAYNEQEQQQLWDYTNYPNQVKQLEQAGLNPGLLYAKPGGGGTTGVAAPVSQGQQAPNNSGMAIQNAAMNAETSADIQLKQAQAAKIKSDTPPDPNDNTGTAQSKVLQAEVPKIQADTQNTDANTALTQVNTDIANIQKQIQGQSADAQVQTIIAGAQTSVAAAISAMAQANVDQKTMDTKISQIIANLTQTYLQNSLIKAQTTTTQTQGVLNKAQTGLTNAQTTTEQQRPDLIKQQANETSQAAAQAWMNANANDQNARTNALRLALDTKLHDTPDSDKMIQDIMEIITGVGINKIPLSSIPKRNPIGFGK